MQVCACVFCVCIRCVCVCVPMELLCLGTRVHAALDHSQLKCNETLHALRAGKACLRLVLSDKLKSRQLGSGCVARLSTHSSIPDIFWVFIAFPQPAV
jgi:hypothetical protein